MKNQVMMPSVFSSVFIKNNRLNKKSILIFEINNGWGLIGVKKKLTEVKDFLPNYLFGFLKQYQQSIRLKGRGYKIVGVTKKLITFKLGFSHSILFKPPYNFKVTFMKRNLFGLKAKSFNKVKDFAFDFRCLRKLNAFKKKGVSFKGEVIRIKDISKKQRK